jgi:hypothetical protein
MVLPLLHMAVVKENVLHNAFTGCKFFLLNLQTLNCTSKFLELLLPTNVC